MPGEDALALGRAALERAAWDEARAHYEQASESGGGAAWEGVSWAAWWQGDLDATFAARERAGGDLARLGPLRLPRRRRGRRRVAASCRGPAPRSPAVPGARLPPPHGGRPRAVR